MRRTGRNADQAAIWRSAAKVANFYRDNLRSAKAEFVYRSDGTPRWVRQKFTFFGFRFVKLTQWSGEVKLENFKGMVLYSNMRQTGTIETSDPKVNKLIENTLWGQRGNYLDVPTDCPQRDERMGWTGDAQVFFGTAAYNMDVSAFFGKFIYDLGQEQAALDGWVPVVIPKHDVFQVGACAWGDAATIIPWQMYVRFGDRRLLSEHYPIMKGVGGCDPCPRRANRRNPPMEGQFPLRRLAIFGRGRPRGLSLRRHGAHLSGHLFLLLFNLPAGESSKSAG